MADEAEFTMTPLRLAVVMSNRVLREHQRIGKRLVALCDAGDLDGLRSYAASLLAAVPSMPSALIPDPTPPAEVVSAQAAQAEIDDGLPEVRHHDDFEQGVHMAIGTRQLVRRLGRA